MNISFTKMQGLGNDFVVIDATQQAFKMSAAQIQKMANRRFGVGFDQLLVVEPPQQPEVDFHFRIFNADGGEVGQCGNGARCIALFIHSRGLSDKTKLRVSTINDRMLLEICRDGKVKVLMCVPKFKPSEIPFFAKQEDNAYQLEVAGQLVRFGVVNVGNPHAVIKLDKVDGETVDRMGPVLSKHPSFPAGVNVGFMQIIDSQHICLRVYERGTGETLACGSGACAAVAVGRRNGWLHERVTVNQPGGNLIIDWQGPKQLIALTGPAKQVFTGQWQD